MKMLHRLNAQEIPVCLIFNRINHLKPVSLFFAAISRLGNGVFWYVLILMLPLIHGTAALAVSAHMALTGMVCLLIYKLLKTSTERQRPYSFDDSVYQNVAALDQFSFPSGHTLHAVNFTLVLLAYYPQWMMLVVPFTILVALSRVVLGLHYPSDVLAGALLGLLVSQASFALI